MAETRDIAEDEAAPSNADWVLIEKAGSKFTANGSVAGEKAATFFTPPPFDTLEAAIAASLQWAEANNAPVVYVRGRS